MAKRRKNALPELGILVRDPELAPYAADLRLRMELYR